MGLFDMLGGFATAGASVYEAGKNYDAQVLTNQANIDMNAANNAQNLALTQQQWARDDNSIQRRTADMRAAGLNPVLAAGQGAQSSAPISMQAGKIIAPQTHGLSGAIGSGVAAYSDLVRAKEIKDQQAATTSKMEWEANQARFVSESLIPAQVSKILREQESLELDNKLKRHDVEYYTRQPIPSALTSSKAGSLLMTRDLVLKYAKENPGVLPSGLLDLLGGAN